MKVITLTTDQVTQIQTLQSALTTAHAPYAAAKKALHDYLKTVVNNSGTKRVVLSDDGNSLIVI